MAVSRNITQPAGKPPSGKVSGGIQGVGKPAGTAHLASRPNSPKPALRGPTAPAGRPASGATVSGVAKGGQMEYPRNNPNRR